MRRNNKNKAFFFVAIGILLFAVHVLFLGNTTNGKNGAEDEIVEVPRDNLCGVNALYLALKFLGEKEVVYEKILSAFSNAKTDGTNIEQLEDFLLKRNYVCCSKRINKKLLRRMETDVYVFVLNMNSESAHFYLLRKLDNDYVQIFNHPQGYSDVKINEFQWEGYPCLFVAKTKKELYYSNFLLDYVLPVFLILGGIILAAFSISKKREATK
jgi:hypothetical protein